MSYLISFIVLVASILLFFALSRNGCRSFGAIQVVLRIVVALPLLGSAVALHFLRTNEATSMLPPIFHGPAFWVLATGVLEVLGAVGLLVARTQRPAAFWLAVMMVLIFPVNVFVAGQTYMGLQMPGVPVRLIMQVIFIWMVLLAGYGLPGNAKKTEANYSSRST
ncbi:hypothetical protein ACPOL_5627 [Acidisarcina polymorpha]|uniref:DoxX family protein n=1 Tax=Acidisarcina polymorpha TaxID=2211140 RepID=A0A2Z5G8A5_9BACT|nr:hypothetical protein [Acidisarcina polymorpha]AXC14875.1 hypothetical protein ACPOL_5627 [Acidisarcina polymorpha]